MNKSTQGKDFNQKIHHLQEELSKVLTDEQNYFEKIGKSFIQHEEKMIVMRNLQSLRAMNDYPSYGAYHYSGSIPCDSVLVNPSKQVLASDVWKTEPLILPSKLPMFDLLMKSDPKYMK